MMRISSRIGNNQNSKAEDIVEVKKALKSLGLYNGEVNVPYIDLEMDRGIHAIQKSQGLKNDGLMIPNGETENALIKLTVKSPQMRCSECGGFHGGVHGDICDDCHIKL